MRTDMERVEDVMQYPDDPFINEKPVSEEEDYSKLSGNVELKNVTFGYSPLGEPVIKDFSMSLKPGNRVAIVGPSGCGKSTLLEMLALLARPDEVSRFSLYDASGDSISLDELWRKNDYDRLAALRRNNFHKRYFVTFLVNANGIGQRNSTTVLFVCAYVHKNFIVNTLCYVRCKLRTLAILVTFNALNKPYAPNGYKVVSLACARVLFNDVSDKAQIVAN
jgi:hypothetical protein